MKVDLAAIIALLNQLADVVMPLFSVFGVLAGFFLIGSAGKELVYGKGQGGQEEMNLTSIAIRLFIAAVLIQFSTSILWTASGLLAGSGAGTRSTVALVVTSTSPTFEAILSASFKWLAVMGMAGMFRGFLKWNEAGRGDSRGGGSDPFWSGLWHIVGGAILFNIGKS